MVYLYNIYLAMVNESVYRSNVFLIAVKNILLFFIMVSVWTALYAGKQIVNGQSLSDMILYILTVSFIKNMTNTKLPSIMHDKIRTGDIASNFVRPVSFMLYSVSEQIGKNLFTTFFSTIPIIIIAIIFYSMSYPKSEYIIFFLLSVLLGMILILQISWIISLFSFWTQSAAFGNFLINTLIEIFGGAVIPLWFYPEVIRKISLCLPFSYMFYHPAGILLGKFSVFDIGKILFIQLIWLLVLIGVERIVWYHAQKVVTIQGG